MIIEQQSFHTTKVKSSQRAFSFRSPTPIPVSSKINLALIMQLPAAKFCLSWLIVSSALLIWLTLQLTILIQQLAINWLRIKCVQSSCLLIGFLAKMDDKKFISRIRIIRVNFQVLNRFNIVAIDWMFYAWNILRF